MIIVCWSAEVNGSLAHWTCPWSKTMSYFPFQKCSIWNNKCRLFLVGMWKRNFLIFLLSDQRKSCIWLHFLICFFSRSHTRSCFYYFSCKSPTFNVFALFWIFFPLQLLLAVKCSRILQIHFICVFVFICNASPAAATPRSSQSPIASSMGKQNCEGIQAQSSWGN